MNKKTLIAGLSGFIIGTLAIPDYGWLLGAVVGGLLGQLLHIGDRLKQLETQLNFLHGGEQRPPAPERRQESMPTPSFEAPVQSAVGTPSQHTATAPSLSRSIQPTKNKTRFPLFHNALKQVGRFFLAGNPIVRAGMVVMLFGLSFLVKYAAGAGLFPVHLRLAVIALIAVVLLVIGWRTREKQNGYGLVLQGGGIAALYLTVFAATKLYSVFPPGLAFLLMLVIVTLGGVLAVLQNAEILALMAAGGGFLAPILTSDGSGNHVLLFSFYLLLNLGVLGVALFKTWRRLNWLGFVFTFVISCAWGVLSYEPQYYNSTQPFLIGFFALYLIVSVLFSIKQPSERRGLVDGSLIFGLPIVGFGLQAGLLRHGDYGLAISALILAAVYLLLASGLWKRYAAAQRLLVEAFVALGLGFATIAIPLALDADWTSATWALEAAGLVWVGLRQRRLLPRLAGYGLYLAAVVSIFINGAFDTGATPIISGDFIGFAILASGAFAIAFLVHRYRNTATSAELLMQWLPIAGGLLWWLVAGFNEIEAHMSSRFYFSAFIFLCSVSFGALLAIAYRLQWPALSRAGYGLLPLVILIILPFLLGWLIDLDYRSHPAANIGLPALMFFGVVQYAFLWWQGQDGKQTLLRTSHVITSWLWLILLFWEAAYWRSRLDMGDTSSLLLWFACFAGPLVLLMTVLHKPRWPFNAYRDLYTAIVPIPPVTLLVFWFLLACRYSGATWYLHLPMLNPLDLAQLAVIVVLSYAVRNQLAGLDRLEPALRYSGLAILAFMWINMVVMRAVHHYSLVPYEGIALWNSATVQMAFSIVWTLCALTVMVGSRRLLSRPIWMAGAGLLALVVIKLFTKDLTGSGTLPRVISFMAVGALMLIIGYLSPIPASRKTPHVEEATS